MALPDLLSLSTLLAWAMQSAILAAAAWAVVRLLPNTSAELRYAAWRVVLLVCVIALWLPGGPGPGEVASAADAVVLTADQDVAEAADGAPDSRAVPWIVLAWVLLGVVATARAVWLSAGLLRLAGLRRRSVALDGAEFDDMQGTLGTCADIREAAGLSQPVTFGFRRPVILLPAAIAGAPERLRRAVVTHELLHVQRRDWAWVIVEEAVRTICWFNPAIWWLTSRVQQAREEVVDHLAVLAIGSRREYIEALLAFADATPLLPAPAFARRAHLFTRIMRLSKESAMSSVRVVSSAVVILAVVAGAGVYARTAFPVAPLSLTDLPAVPRAPVASAATAQAQGAPAAPRPITPDNPIPRRIYSVTPLHPVGLEDLSAVVQVIVRLDRLGIPTVSARRAVAISARPGVSTRPAVDEASAGNAFYTAAAEAIAQWRYDAPAEAPLEFIVSVRFTPDRPTFVAQFETWSASEAAWRDDARRGVAPPGPPPPPPPPPAPRGPFAPAAPPAPGTSQAPFTPAAPPTPPPPPAPPAPAAAGSSSGSPAPLRVGASVRPPVKTRDVRPGYPAEAQAAGVEGVVILEVTIDGTGNVSDTRVLRSIPLLDQAALDAVRQWQFQPTLLNGVPVPVLMTVTIQFTLG